MNFPMNKVKFTFPRLYLGNKLYSDVGYEPIRLIGIEADCKFKIATQEGYFSINIQLFGFGLIFIRQTSY